MSRSAHGASVDAQRQGQGGPEELHRATSVAIVEGGEEGGIGSSNLLPQRGVVLAEDENGLNEATVWGVPVSEEEELLEGSALTAVLLG